jgi:hypothetical protein
MRKSTFAAFNNPQRSRKSLWNSVGVFSTDGHHVFAPEAFDFLEALVGRTTEPVFQSEIVGVLLSEAREADNPVH